jgi:hypothetical protein
MFPLTLHGLDPGEVRSLTPREVKALKALGRGDEGKKSEDDKRVGPKRR